MALELLQAFGRPADVAQRYGPSTPLLDPADTRDFLIAALVGAARSARPRQAHVAEPSA